MKSPSQQAEFLIKNKFSLIDEIYRESIPKEIIGNQAKTICLITEWLNEPTYYANATFKGWTIGVEVQLFYRKALSGEDVTNLEIKLAKKFVHDKWTVEQSKAHVKDPDTGQSTKVFYFAKDLVIKGV